MPTLPLRVQQNGWFTGWQSLVGGIFGYDCVDDSDGTTHDSAATYLVLPKLNLATMAGIVSFPLFDQVENIVPTSITINVVATQGGASHPRLQIGFQRGGTTAFSGSLFTTDATWAPAQRTFSVNPLTGQPWAPSDLVGLEACVQNEAGVNGNNDITLISGSITGYPLTNGLLVQPAVNYL